MLLFDMTSVRAKALGFITSAMLMLLLGWQSNVKSTHAAKSFVAASQSALDASKEIVDPCDFDPVILLIALQHDELNQWFEPTITLLLAPFSHTFIPQSRAPPVII